MEINILVVLKSIDKMLSKAGGNPTGVASKDPYVECAKAQLEEVISGLEKEDKEKPKVKPKPRYLGDGKGGELSEEAEKARVELLGEE